MITFINVKLGETTQFLSFFFLVVCLRVDETIKEKKRLRELCSIISRLIDIFICAKNKGGISFKGFRNSFVFLWNFKAPTSR